jgi:hypothetical protein
MKLLRETIRRLILERKIEKDDDTIANISLKKQWSAKADQASLKKLRYIHWGSIEEIQKLLYSQGRSEISTSIHLPRGDVTPWTLGTREPVVGVELKGWVTMASNIDLDSGRHDRVHKRGAKLTKDMELQKKTSGIPKRPSASFTGERIAFADMDGEPITTKSGQIAQNIEDVLIYKAEDFIDRKGYNYNSDNAEWPEAILDNWKAVAVYSSHSYTGSDEDDQRLIDLDMDCDDLGIPNLNLDI